MDRKKTKNTYEYDLPRTKIITPNSWFHDKQRYIEALPFFWIRDPLKFLFGTEQNKMTGAYEWRMASRYTKRDFFYSVFWFVFCLLLLSAAAWISNFWNLFYNGCYLVGQGIFRENEFVDRCCSGTMQDYLMVYSMPDTLYDRYTLRSITDDEKKAGYAENVYYAPSKAYNTIAFRTMMAQMRQWIEDRDLESKCVCFFHFGVGIKGGFYGGQFYIDHNIVKQSEERVYVTVGGTKWNVPERASVMALGDSSCIPVESKINKEASACLSYCGT